MLRFRMIGSIMRAAGMGPTILGFLIVFFCCSVGISWVEPGMANIGDALWFCFETVTTIGFGDVYAVTVVGRIITVILSITSIFFLAVITGVVVNYCSEAMKARQSESIAQFMDYLEHLPSLSQEELASLSERIKHMRAKQQ